MRLFTRVPFRRAAFASLAALLVFALPLDAQKKNRKRQNPPIKMGTGVSNDDAFNIEALAVYCTGGTAAALLESGQNGDQSYFVLGTNSVLARTNAGERGADTMLQPSLIFTRCDPAETNTNRLGVLSGFKRIKFGGGANKVDAAIVEATAAEVNTSGTVIGIGQIANNFVNPTVGMAVKKSGAGTGVKRGVIVAKNFAIDIIYALSIGPPFNTDSARFTKQLVIASTNPDKRIFDLGDSGAIVVEDKDDCPAPVGMMVASDGTGLLAVANTAKNVLNAAKQMTPKGTKTFVGCEPAAVASSTRADPAALRAERLARRAQRRLHFKIEGLDGLVGTGISADDAGKPMVFVALARDDEELRNRIPREINGVPTDIRVTGEFVAGGMGVAKQ